MVEFKIVVNHYSKSLGQYDVLYVPEDERCHPVTQGIAIIHREDITEDEILRIMKMNAPQIVWQQQIESFEKDHTVFSSLVGQEITSSDIEVTEEHISELQNNVPTPAQAPQVSSEVDAFIAEILNAQINQT